MLTYLFPAAALLCLLSALSLFAKSEAFRGAGRVAGGLGLILLGTFLALIFHGLTQQVFLYWSAWTVIACGVITAGSGLRKFIRRNAAQ